MSDRRRNSGGGGHEGGDERWLLTYADMITLLLVLFIVLFAMSSIDAQKFDNVRRSLSETFTGEVLQEPGSVLDGSKGPGDPVNANSIPDKKAVTELIQATNATAARYATEGQRLKGLAKETRFGKNITVSNAPNGNIVLRIAGDALFASGRADLKPGVRADLVKIERELATFGAKIEIVGHTDGAPFNGPTGNYQLGSDRAMAVVSLFLAQGFPGGMKASSSADQSPIKQPDFPTQSVSANRRIEITVLAPGADDRRPRTVQMIASVKSIQRAKTPPSQPPAPVSESVQTEIDAGIASDLARTASELG